MPEFSIIIPVYNRPDEVADLLDSLEKQTVRNFEVVLVEDGSTVPCRQQADRVLDRGLDVKYFAKDNEGRSIDATTAWSAPPAAISCFSTPTA